MGLVSVQLDTGLGASTGAGRGEPRPVSVCQLTQVSEGI